MDKFEEFKALLEGVSDSYDGFVEGGLIEAKDNDEYIEKITKFIKDNPEANTSDIIQFETEEIFGIKPIIQKHKCPVCGQHEFAEYGSFDFCPVCGWCDDPLEGSRPDYKGGYNGMSVQEYRIAWKNNDPRCDVSDE